MSGVPKKPNSAGNARIPERGHAFSATVSVPRSLAFVAGAFPRSADDRAHGAYRKGRDRAADHSDQDTSGAITGPPQRFGGGVGLPTGSALPSSAKVGDQSWAETLPQGRLMNYDRTSASQHFSLSGCVGFSISCCLGGRRLSLAARGR
jgi:hypothetical protein